MQVLVFTFECHKIICYHLTLIIRHFNCGDAFSVNTTKIDRCVQRNQKTCGEAAASSHGNLSNNFPFATMLKDLLYYSYS